MIPLAMSSLMNQLTRLDIILGHRRSHHRKAHLDGHKGTAALLEAAPIPWMVSIKLQTEVSLSLPTMDDG